jgi:hypothetical protein
MADALRGGMDAAEYKHVVLGLVFLKYISDAFEEQHTKLEAEKAQGADPEDPDEYRALSIFWVPPEARWWHLKAQAKQPTIGQLVDDAMSGIERDNASLKGVLPKDYARPGLDKQRRHAAKEPCCGTTQEAPIRRDPDEAEKKRRPSEVVRGHARTSDPEIPKPRHRSSASYRRNDRARQRHAPGERTRRDAKAQRRRAGVLRRARNQR